MFKKILIINCCLFPKKFLISIVWVLGCFLSFSAHAQNTGGVFGPSVNDGHKSFQYRATIDPDNAQSETGFAQRLHYQQAINDDFMWRILGQTRKTSDSDTDFDFVQAELFWEFNATDTYQTGVRFDLRIRDNDRPDQIGVNWIHQYQLQNNWSARFLVLGAAQVGSNANDGVSLQVRGNIAKKTAFGGIGIEMFNNFGNSRDFGSFDEQMHTIGPFAELPLGKNGWSAFVGSLFGVSDAAADLELRFWLTKNL